MNRRQFVVTAMAGAPFAFGADNKRPNIIVMLADDMGFSDLGCYGSEISTPNIDRLANNGLRFTQFYNTARCCPTRAALLTGLYSHQAGVGHMVEDRGKPGYRGDLNRQCVTIAEALRPAGYRTAMSGKWHVTPAKMDDRHNWPLQRGFDQYFGIIHGAASYYNPVSLVRDNQPVQPNENFYLTDAIADNAIRYIGDYAGKPDPFFLYCAFTSPHWPLHALPRDIEKYRDRYRGGWDALRAERHRRMIETGIVKSKWPLTPRDPQVPAWEDAKDKDWHIRRMAVYAAQIDRMDQNVGRIVAKLEQTGALDNTLILFLSDNGGCAEDLPKNPKNWPIHIPHQTRAGQPMREGNDPGIMPGPEDTYQSYGIGWANASNTPFRLYKHWVHEGGISTPLIAHWPSGMKQRNALTDQPGHLIDIMATCVDAGGAQYPTSYRGNAITPLEGKSLLPILRTGRRDPHEFIFWEHEGNRAARQGNWKLVSRFPQKWELYDLEADRTEMKDMAAREPDRRDRMIAAYDTWAKRANVLPWEEVK